MSVVPEEARAVVLQHHPDVNSNALIQPVGFGSVKTLDLGITTSPPLGATRITTVSGQVVAFPAEHDTSENILFFLVPMNNGGSPWIGPGEALDAAVIIFPTRVSYGDTSLPLFAWTLENFTAIAGIGDTGREVLIISRIRITNEIGSGGGNPPRIDMGFQVTISSSVSRT